VRPGDERLEGARQELGRKAPPSIAHRDADPFVAHRDVDLERLVRRVTMRPGVREDVVERSTEKRGVDRHALSLGAPADGERDGALALGREARTKPGQKLDLLEAEIGETGARRGEKVPEDGVDFDERAVGVVDGSGGGDVALSPLA